MFDSLKKAKQIIELLDTMQKMDADHNGRADWQDYLVLAGELAKLLDSVKAIVAKIESLFGDNIEVIKEKLGVKDSPEAPKV